MKVIPQVKTRKLKSNEVRFITIEAAAIEELLLENLMKYRGEYFELDDDSNLDVSEQDVCVMSWNKSSGMLTYAIMPIKYYLDGYCLNTEYIQSTYKKTTNTLFQPNRYKAVTLTDKMLIKKAP